LYAGWSYLF